MLLLVAACFLEASKAFGRVNRTKLFRKLYERLLVYWYSSQEYVIKWRSTLSFGFNVSNGIRHGGRISPVLCNIYTDSLSDLLRGTKIGCHIGGGCVNHISFADDTVLLVPSAKALQILLNVCSVYAGDYDIKFNPLKTVCMVFRLKSFSNTNVENFKLGDTPLKFIKVVVYLSYHICDNLNPAECALGLTDPDDFL